jgi:hypothetical protein
LKSARSPSSAAAANGSGAGTATSPHNDDVIAESLAYRRLAMRVIERAFRDVSPQGSGARERQTAREFLGGSVMLFHWCQVARLDPRRVISSALALESRTRALLIDFAASSGDRPAG